jgi:hypothetical protein
LIDIRQCHSCPLAGEKSMNIMAEQGRAGRRTAGSGMTGVKYRGQTRVACELFGGLNVVVFVMFCDACGSAMGMDQRFCGFCGKPVGVFHSRPGYPEGRVSRHVQLVGILTMVGSALGLLWGIGLLRVTHGLLGHLHRPFPLFFLPHSFGMWIFGCAPAGVIAGWGLLKRRPWARSLALLTNSLALLNIPFGTIVGIYSLWVLLPRESEEEYRRLAN